MQVRGLHAPAHASQGDKQFNPPEMWCFFARARCIQQRSELGEIFLALLRTSCSKQEMYDLGTTLTSISRVDNTIANSLQVPVREWYHTHLACKVRLSYAGSVVGNIPWFVPLLYMWFIRLNVLVLRLCAVCPEVARTRRCRRTVISMIGSLQHVLSARAVPRG